MEVPEGRKKNEKTREPDAEEVLEPQPKKKRTESKNPSPVANTLSRGNYLVNLSNFKSKRISQSKEKIVPAAKITRKRMDVCSGEMTTVKETEAPAFKEINRALLKVDKTPKNGSGSFGNCYIALYRNEFRVVVKELKGKDSSNQTKEEVLREAAAITGIGDHWGIPHLFGVCTEQAPRYLVLQFHAMDSQSVTLLKAASEGIIQDVVKCANILKQTCEVHIDAHRCKRLLHNDQKANNVVIDGAENKPVIIDFGNSCKIVN